MYALRHYKFPKWLIGYKFKYYEKITTNIKGKVLGT